MTIQTLAEGVRFSVRVQPRASRSEICGEHGESLKVRLAAPPVDGAANAALIVLLADELDVSRRSIRIVSGLASRTKVVQIDGIAPDSVKRLAARGS